MYMDAIFLIVTLVVGYLLYLKLGKRTGSEKSPLNPFYQNKPKAHSASGSSKGPVAGEDAVNIPLITSLKQIQLTDKKFSQYQFIEEIKVSFETILRAFVEGNKEIIRPFLNERLYNFYKDELDALEKKNIKGELLFFRLISAVLTSIDIKEGMAKIQVQFISEQTQIRKNKSGKVIQGDSNIIDRINELWTFERPLKFANPRWILSKIVPFKES